jgi:hypothetical protein
MDCVVAPLLQTLPLGAVELSVTVPPAQKVVGPLGVTDGVEGMLDTVTATGLDVAELQPLATAMTV